MDKIFDAAAVDAMLVKDAASEHLGNLTTAEIVCPSSPNSVPIVKSDFTKEENAQLWRTLDPRRPEFLAMLKSLTRTD